MEFLFKVKYINNFSVLAKNHMMILKKMEKSHTMKLCVTTNTYIELHNTSTMYTYCGILLK